MIINNLFTKIFSFNELKLLFIKLKIIIIIILLYIL